MYFSEGNSSTSLRKKGFILALVGVLAVTATLAVYYRSSAKSTYLLEAGLLEEQEFKSYMSSYGKSYTTEEFPSKFQAFRNNLGYIRVHNSMNKPWYLAVNKYSDMSNEEFRSKYVPHKYPVSQSPSTDSVESSYSYPQSVNWVAQGGVVTGVKDQGQCGSCWAFSTTGATEGAWALAGHGLVSLSEQQLVDCSSGNYGCGGGWPTVAMQYIIDNGITTESNYPYVAYNQNCNTAATKAVAATLHSYVNVPQNNYPSLAAAVAQQPISVLVEADGPDWQSYGGGIVTDQGCGTYLDHAVLAVGYNFGNATPYWIVKNSWGTGWGENGYIRLAIVAGNGICGVQMSPAYPVV